MTTCSACGREIEIGDYPFCPHGSIYPEASRRFDPLVIWVANDNPDRISVPGDAGEPVADGYHKVEITSLREADYWTRKINAIETSKVERLRDSEKQYWDEVTRERRATIKARIGSNPRALALFKAVREFVDRKRERRYSRPLDARAHFDVIAYDSSNREGWSGPETGWKTKRK